MQYITIQVMAQLLEAVMISSLPRMQMQILHLLVMLAIPITTSWLDQRTSLYQSSKSFSFNPITLGLLFGVLHFTDDSIHFTRWIRVQFKNANCGNAVCWSHLQEEESQEGF